MPKKIKAVREVLKEQGKYRKVMEVGLNKEVLFVYVLFGSLYLC